MAVVDNHPGAELLGSLQPRVGHVDGHGPSGGEESCRQDRGQPDRTSSRHHHRVAWTNRPVQDTNLVAGWPDIGKHQDGLVGHLVWTRVGRSVGEGDADVLGLRPIDEVSEYPAAPARAESVAAATTEPAPSAGRDARNQHAIARADRLNARTDLLDGTDGFMTKDPPIGDSRHITLEDVEVGPTDGHGIHADDGVGVLDDRRVRDLLPALLPGSVINDRAHRRYLPSPVPGRGLPFFHSDATASGLDAPRSCTAVAGGRDRELFQASTACCSRSDIS